MYIGVTNLNTQICTSSDTTTITVTWDAVNSSYCGGVLYYIVMISSDVHSNIMNDIVNVTDLSLLTATFSNLMDDTVYNVTVTPFNRAGVGLSTMIKIKIPSRRSKFYIQSHSVETCVHNTVPYSYSDFIVIFNLN